MGYSNCLTKAGATVLAFENFGDYQGTWYALVEYESKKGIIEGAYGSCSGCDAFESEFAYNDVIIVSIDGKYYRDNNNYDGSEEITKEEADVYNKALEEKLANFGKFYLNNIQDKNIIQTRLDAMLKLDPDEDYVDEEELKGLKWCLNQLT